MSSRCEIIIVALENEMLMRREQSGLADKWARHTKFNNCCGPTEISICNTVQPHTPGYPLSIGKPIPNTNVYILSRDPSKTRPVPIGQVGCMWVGGIGVGWVPNTEGGKKTAHTGYLNLPDKNAERWRPDPFVKGGMMFNTGDLGRWRKDGQLDHMGRADDQVKVKGFRVELDGVSAAMRVGSVLLSQSLLCQIDLWLLLRHTRPFSTRSLSLLTQNSGALLHRHR